MTDSPRSEWTDARLTETLSRLERRINSMPDRLTVLELSLQNIGEDAREAKEEMRAMRRDFTASLQCLSRGEKIALIGASGGFLGAVAAVIALLSGAA